MHMYSSIRAIIACNLHSILPIHNNKFDDLFVPPILHPLSVLN